MSQRQHPYSQKQKQTSFESKSIKKQSKNENQLESKTISKKILTNYDLQSYVDEANARTSKSINVYPTLKKPIKIPDNTKKTETKLKGILVDKTNLKANVSSRTDNLKYLSKESVQNEQVAAIKDEYCDRMFTSDIESLKFLTPKLEKNSKDKSINKQHIEAGYNFIIYGQLDSTIFRDEDGNKSCFAIKDRNDRLRCLFYSIDREMPKIARSKIVRCVGKLKGEEFHVFQIREARSTELLFADEDIRITNIYLKKNFF